MNFFIFLFLGEEEMSNLNLDINTKFYNSQYIYIYGLLLTSL